MQRTSKMQSSQALSRIRSQRKASLEYVSRQQYIARSAERRDKSEGSHSSCSEKELQQLGAKVNKSVYLSLIDSYSLPKSLALPVKRNLKRLHIL